MFFGGHIRQDAHKVVGRTILLAREGGERKEGLELAYALES